MKNIKNLILTAIEEKLQTNSFKNVSIDSIAKELHISKRTIYEIFKSKESILEILVDIYQQKFIDYADSIATQIQKGELSFATGIYDLLKHYSAKHWSHSEIFNFLPEKAKKIFAKRKNVFMKFYDIAVNEGVIKKDVNKDIYFMIIQTCGLALHDPKFRQEHDINVTSITDFIDFMNIINLGILTEKGKDIYTNKQC
jgi:AcrR family transcriptional regulator